MSDDLILKAVVGGGLTVYFIWLGRTVFDVALTVKGMKETHNGTKEVVKANGEEILRTRARLHKAENVLQEHELRLDVLETWKAESPRQ